MNRRKIRVNKRSSASTPMMEAGTGNRVRGNLVIGSIEQVINLILQLTFPWKRQYGHYVRFIAFCTYVICVLVGFVALWVDGYPSHRTQILLGLGNVFLILTCVYYVGFWEIPGMPSRINYLDPKYAVDTNKDFEKEFFRVSGLKQKDEKKRNKEVKRVIGLRGLKCLAALGIITFPFLTYSGYHSLTTYISSHTTLLTLADFYQTPSGGDGENVTTIIFNGLRSATETDEDRTDVTIKRLNKTIKSAGQTDAQSEGNARLADLVVWGTYGKKPSNIYSYFEFLKAPPIFPVLSKEVAWGTGETRTFPIKASILAEIDHDIETKISPKLAYLTFFCLGLADYKSGNYKIAIDRFDAALKQAKSFQESATELGLSFVYFWRGNAKFYNALFSNSGIYYDGAIEDFTKAIELNPEHAQAPYSWNNVYANRHNHSIVLADYKISQNTLNLVDSKDDQEKICTSRERDDYIVTSDSPDRVKDYLAKIYNNRGITYVMQSDNERALADFRKSRELDRDTDELCNSLGIVYTDIGDYGSAIQNFSEAIELNPEDALAYNNRGNAYFYQEKYDKAIEDYDKAIKLNSNFSEAYYNRGRTHFILKEKEALSIQDFNKAIQLKPRFADIYYYSRGEDYLARKEYDRAIENFEKAVEFNEKFAEAHYRLAEAYYSYYWYRLGETELASEVVENSNNFDKAIENLEKAIELNPNFAEAFYNFGELKLGRQKYAEAVKNLEKAIELKPELIAKLNPNFAEAYLALVEESLNKRDYAQATKYLDKALELKPNSAEVSYNQGRIYFEQENYNQAIATLDRAIGLKTDYVEAHALRANAYRLQGNYDKALEDLSKAIDIDPDYINSYYVLGLIYNQQGNSEKAIENFVEVVQSNASQELRGAAVRELQKLQVGSQPQANESQVNSDSQAGSEAQVNPNAQTSDEPDSILIPPSSHPNNAPINVKPSVSPTPNRPSFTPPRLRQRNQR